MNRQIKFRGKQKDGDGWAEGNLLRRGNSTFIILVNDELSILPCLLGKQLRLSCDIVEVVPGAVGQFTDLPRDKDNKEIYQSDIIKTPWNEIYLVMWHFNRWVLKSINGGIYEFKKASFDAGYYEVIGNIHDNKDLLRA
jgi:hypothetical protein